MVHDPDGVGVGRTDPQVARTQLGLDRLTTSLPFERKTVGLRQAAPHYGEAKNSLVTPTIAMNAPHRRRRPPSAGQR